MKNINANIKSTNYIKLFTLLEKSQKIFFNNNLK